jgi:hypothetical protein
MCCVLYQLEVIANQFNLLQEAIALLDPMTNDPVNFVRQGALIASAMILIQQTEHTCPKVRSEIMVSGIASGGPLCVSALKCLKFKFQLEHLEMREVIQRVRC